MSVSHKKGELFSRAFPYYTKLAFLYYLNLKIKVDAFVRHIYFDSNCHVNCKLESKFIQLVTITNLVSLKLSTLCITGKLE